MRSKPLQAYLRGPFLWLLAGTLLLSMLLFNIALRLYLNQSIKKDLRAARGTLELIVQKEAEGKLTLKNAPRVLPRLERSLGAAGLLNGIDLYLYDEKGELLYPDEEALFDAPRRLMRLSPARLARMRESRVYSFLSDGERYLALPFPLASDAMLLLVGPAANASRLIRTVDLMLLLLFSLALLCAALASNALARRIARPVTLLCARLRAVEGGRVPDPGPPAVAEIAELAYLEESLSQMQARLFAYDRAQKSFLADASHELKTPLMSIQGYAEAITRGVTDTPSSAAEVILRESKRLSALVGELLTLSRMDTAAHPQQTLNLNEALPELEQRLQGVAAREGRKLSLQLPAQPLCVLGDEELLSQAVTNIAENCLRYAKAEVTMTLLQKENSAVLRIADDGDGIPDEELPHLFERFFKGKKGGSGLGLSIAASAAAAMGGRIAAYNGAPGAVFELTLPLAP